MWDKIITIKRTKDLNYFSLWAFNLFNTQVSQFELNYWNKWTFPRHSNLLRCTCIWLNNPEIDLIKQKSFKKITDHLQQPYNNKQKIKKIVLVKKQTDDKFGPFGEDWSHFEIVSM